MENKPRDKNNDPKSIPERKNRRNQIIGTRKDEKA